MFGTLLTAAVLFVLFIPGIFFAYRKQSLTLRFMLKCLLLNVSFFALLGLIFQALPWIIDPRLHL